MIIAAIPARAGSSLKDKNIADINGKPALAYSIETALEVPEIDRVVVTTDSDNYAEIAYNWGADVIARPPELCQDDSPDLGWLKHFMTFINMSNGLKEYTSEDKTIVILRPTTPLRKAEVVSEAIRWFIDRSKGILLPPGQVDSLRSVHEMSESAWKCFEIHQERLVPLRSYTVCNLPRQKVTSTYHPNGYVDIIHASNLYNNTVYGTNILAYITPRTTEIDTIEDLEYIRWEVNKPTHRICDAENCHGRHSESNKLSKESLKTLSDELKAVDEIEGR